MIIQTKFTDGGIPKLGLTPTLRIRKVSDNSLVVTDAAMSEVGGGWYKYTFTAYTGSVDYAMRADGGAVITGYERYTAMGNENFVTDIWDAQTANHTVSGSLSAGMEFIHNSENGGWKVESGKLIIYKEDNITEVAQFNIFDSNNESTSAPDEISERKRI